MEKVFKKSPNYIKRIFHQFKNSLLTYNPEAIGGRGELIAAGIVVAVVFILLGVYEGRVAVFAVSALLLFFLFFELIVYFLVSRSSKKYIVKKIALTDNGLHFYYKDDSDEFVGFESVTSIDPVWYHSRSVILSFSAHLNLKHQSGGEVKSIPITFDFENVCNLHKIIVDKLNLEDK